MATKAKAKAVEPTPAPAEEVVEIDVGSAISFLGYGEEVEPEDRYLTEGEQYTVSGFSDEGNPLVEIPNPDFKPKVKEHPENNPKLVAVEVLPEEFEVVEGEAAEQAEVAEEAADPAPVPKGKGKAAAKEAPAAKTAAKGKEKAAPAKKTAPAKKAAKVAAEATAEEPVNETPDLDNEDADVLALIEGEDVDLVAVAQDLEHQAGSTEWKLGGVLYHIKKDGAFTKLVDEKNKRIKDYDEAGGFDKFVQDYFNIEYRKATYLIKIYRDFTIAGIENPGEVLANIGWTKAKTIAEKMGKEGVAEPTELIELAEQNTVDDLKTIIKEQIEVGGSKTPGEKKTRVTLKFRLFEEEGKTAEQIIVGVKEQLGLKDENEALMHILTEYAAEHGGGEAEVETAPKQAVKPAAKAARRASMATA